MILLSNTIITLIDTLLDHNEKDDNVQFISLRMHCGIKSLKMRKLTLFITNRKQSYFLTYVYVYMYIYIYIYTYIQNV